MNIKEEKAVAGVDMVIAIAAIIIFSMLILTLITNNLIENVKIVKESRAIIYLTEIFEQIGIDEYNYVTEENIKDLLPFEFYEDYNIEIEIQENISELADKKDVIMKKVIITIEYKIGKNSYMCSMERLKVKE